MTPEPAPVLDLPALRAQIAALEAQNARLSLTNKMLKDKVRDLVSLLADFGHYEPF